MNQFLIDILSLLSCILFQSSLQLDESSPNWYFCLYFNQVLQLDKSASNWYFCFEKQKTNIPYIFPFIQNDWELRYIKIQDFQRTKWYF